ncbi:carboxymuconolactone decarboxylase family protein [Ilumatobacter sp.]|uniref:carboxymuconolactone decarboxylase family protein n=1 Tax=Ilumatobacter sp. TaxID=1967498 RepID=UPI0037523E03
MPRLNEVSREENESPLVEQVYGRLFGDRDPVNEPGTATGTQGDWWTVFANDHAVFEHAVQGFRVYRRAALDPMLRELGQTRAGWLVGSQFVYSQHCKSLRGLGATEEQIAGVAVGAGAPCWNELERLVLGYADCLVTGQGRVPDAIFDGLRAHLPDAQILELTYITCLYSQHAVMSKALRTEFDDVDERIVEVAAPDDFDPRDIVRDISVPDQDRTNERQIMEISDAETSDAGEEE